MPFDLVAQGVPLDIALEHERLLKGSHQDFDAPDWIARVDAASAYRTFHAISFHLLASEMQTCIMLMLRQRMAFVTEPPSPHVLNNVRGVIEDRLKQMGSTETFEAVWDEYLNEGYVGHLLDELHVYAWVHDRHFDRPEPNTFGIPTHKLETNEGWLINPSEIDTALERGRAWSKENRTSQAPVFVNHQEIQWWPDWLRFLEINAEREGFRCR